MMLRLVEVMSGAWRDSKGVKVVGVVRSCAVARGGWWGCQLDVEACGYPEGFV